MCDGLQFLGDCGTRPPCAHRRAAHSCGRHDGRAHAAAGQPALCGLWVWAQMCMRNCHAAQVLNWMGHSFCHLSATGSHQVAGTRWAWPHTTWDPTLRPSSPARFHSRSITTDKLPAGRRGAGLSGGCTALDCLLLASEPVQSLLNFPLSRRPPRRWTLGRDAGRRCRLRRWHAPPLALRRCTTACTQWGATSAPKC